MGAVASSRMHAVCLKASSARARCGCVALNPRIVMVDIVQAVAVSCARQKDKEYGYIVRPVAVANRFDPAVYSMDNQRFLLSWVYGVPCAPHRPIRCGDQPELISTTDRQIEFSLGRRRYRRRRFEDTLTLPFPPLDLPPGASMQIVEKCGTAIWETWAKDVADIFTRLVMRTNSR